MSFFARIIGFLRGLVPSSKPLCDTCKYDYGQVCTRPERPNALRCSDYKHR